jgi:hypothetical protein
MRQPYGSQTSPRDGQQLVKERSIRLVPVSTNATAMPIRASNKEHPVTAAQPAPVVQMTELSNPQRRVVLLPSVDHRESDNCDHREAACQESTVEYRVLPGSFDISTSIVPDDVDDDSECAHQHSTTVARREALQVGVSRKHFNLQAPHRSCWSRIRSPRPTRGYRVWVPRHQLLAHEDAQGVSH